MRIDYKLKKILHLLSINSRATTREISKQTKTTQQNISHLISKLQSNTIIDSFIPIVDSSKFGLNNFCVFLSLKINTKIFLKELNIELKKYKEITAIDILFGNYDFFIRFTTPNASFFNKVLKEILNKFQNGINNYIILTQIVLYHYPRNYLSKKNSEQKIIVSGDRETIPLDSINKEILNLLNFDARINFVKIANRLNTTAKTIITRVRNLEKTKVIRGYTLNLNHTKLNLTRFYILIKFDFVDIDTEKKFIQYTQYSPNIIEFVKVFGEWDVLLIVETENNIEFKKILNEIKEDFSDQIENYSFLESESIKKWNYLPELEL